MAATELLDYNQVQEQSPSTGDAIPASGGPIIWQFRADPNLAWDPSQSFFAMDVTVADLGASSATGNNVDGGQGALGARGTKKAYVPDVCDFRPFFPLRCFNGASHVIDGVTVASTNHPYLDKIIQEKFLHETTLSNYGNFESLSLARAIDDGIKEHNLFRAHADSLLDLYEQGWRCSIQLFNADRCGEGHDTTGASFPTHTVLFQPPFDFWTKHQRVSGGNHQVTLNLKAADGDLLTVSAAGAGPRWGGYAGTTCVGLGYAHAALRGKRVTPTKTQAITGFVDATDIPDFVALALQKQVGVQMEIHRIRLLRRMVRFTIERPIATQEYNLTEMQLYVGQPDLQSMTQN